MKLFAPPYYKKFRCIADRCRHSCCVGWEIDVDEAALSRYEALGGEGRKILGSIDFDGDTPHFRLLDGDRCPHLDGSGLCSIISRLGEGYLCDICREHPRFYNFPSGRVEVGLGAACEEAARLILECEDYAKISEISDVEDGEAETNFDTVGEREKIYEILSKKSLPYSERLSLLYGRYQISPASISNAEWRELIGSLEYLDEKNRELFLSYTSKAAPKEEKYAERAFAYFIYRHTASAESKEELCRAFGLAAFLERLYATLLEAFPAAPTELFRAVSEEIEYSEDNTEIIKAAYL